MLKSYSKMLKEEFANYSAKLFLKDVVSGITVSAVALPLALAFGVASGADAAAGLITAIFAGIICGILGGARFQISGPTGAMTAVLVTIVAQFGMQGVFVASLIAGVIVLLMGICRLGKLIQFIPRPVVTGFTSGIAIIIFLGQIDNFFGTHSEGLNIFEKFASYGRLGFAPQWQAVLIAVIVIAFMFLFPKKWNAKVPASLIAIILATVISYFCKFDIATIGEIPRTLVHATRLDFSTFDFASIGQLISPAFTIAALGMIESLLCGTSALTMQKGAKFHPNQELVAQGVCNILLPFVGGVPSTAAIARTSVAIKSGCATRVTGLVQAVALIIIMFALSPIMSKVPLAALAGVLMVTAIRMNEWHQIKYFVHNKLWGAVSKFAITLVATVAFDLTVAIAIGVIYSLFLMAIRMSKLEIETSPLSQTVGENATCDKATDNKQNVENVTDSENANANANANASSTALDKACGDEKAVLVYTTGAMFFANAAIFRNKISTLHGDFDKLIFVMRGVNYLDVSAAQTILELFKDEQELGKQICLTGTRDNVKKLMDKVGITALVGEQNFFESVDKVLLASESNK